MNKEMTDYIETKRQHFVRKRAFAVLVGSVILAVSTLVPPVGVIIIGGILIYATITGLHELVS